MADLTVKITESIVLNGRNQGSKNTVTIPGITEVTKRIVHTGDVSDHDIVLFGATLAPGQYVVGDVRYVRITNLESLGGNYATISIEGAGATDIAVRLDPGASYILTSSSSTGLVDYADISGSTLEDLTKIKAQANTAAVSLEVLVASV
tara:strand:+ start:594 stop:1040 length:447 start_codon:yes stop_codon:yes gene_type:complete